MAVTGNGTRGNPTFLSTGNAPDFAADLGKVAEYAAIVGNKVVGTSAQRSSFNLGAGFTGPWESVDWVETDTGRTYRYTAGKWVEMVRTSAWTTYVPSWTAASSAPSIGNGTLSGRWCLLGPKTLQLRINISWGTTTNGGRGAYVFGLPPGFTSSVLEQEIICKAFTSGANNWTGIGVVDPSGTTIRPFLPLSPSTSALGQVANTNSSSTLGTGVPQISGQHTFSNTTNLVLQGSIELT